MFKRVYSNISVLIRVGFLVSLGCIISISRCVTPMGLFGMCYVWLVGVSPPWGLMQYVSLRWGLMQYVSLRWGLMQYVSLRWCLMQYVSLR